MSAANVPVRPESITELEARLTHVIETGTAAEIDDIHQRLLRARRAARGESPLDDCAYHGLAGAVVRTILPHTEADPVALLVQFLVAAGNMIGRGPHYRVEGDEHHANLFAVLVGETSKARKGTSWGRIRSVLAGVEDTWNRDCVQSGLSSGEGLIHAVRDPLGEDDPGVEDKRLCVAESEFAGLLRVMTRDGNIISRIVRDAWDRGDLRTMTKTSPSRATGAHISVVGHVTDEELRRYLDRTECANGFANRFLYVSVKRSKLLPHGGSLDERDLLTLSRDLAEAAGRARVVRRVRMDDDASRRWEAVYPALSEGMPGLVGAVTGRAEAQTIRLALLYALLDGRDEIRAEHLRAALALWAYCESSAVRIFGDATGDPVADTILRALGNSPDGLTRTDISRVLGRNASASRITTALRELARTGKAHATSRETGGRAAEVWHAC